VVTSILVTTHKMGKNIKVYVNETRPKYQGYITALELSREGIDVTLVIDAAAGYFLRNADLVLVGADAISSHGALVNKIGTSQLALLARTMNVPFYSAAETYKFSPNTMIGEMIEIEERDYTEVVDKDFIDKYKINVRNPAFDITPPQYISAIITEKGIIPPIGVALILVEEYGWTLGEEFPSNIIEEN
ncbi:MAG: S-methyl-5-thioribose-1-phosphate isomerase, partial [Thermoprotei archaeon]